MSWGQAVLNAERLSPLGEAMAVAVADYRTRRVPIAVVMAAAAEVDHMARSVVGWREPFAAAVDELAGAGLVTLPRTRFDRSAEPPLPAYLRRPAPETPTRAVRPVIWHAELAWVAIEEDAGRLGAGDRAFLEQINGWLSRRRTLVVPLRERSLEIFDDEKAIERRILGPLFGPGRLSLELLRCEACWPPVHQQHFGPGPWLIIENYTTYVSLGRCAARSGYSGRVIWGSGNQVGTRIDALAMGGEMPTTMWYFGDLDAGGARVARTAEKRCVDAGFPPLQPARALYALALEHGKVSPEPAPVGTASHARWVERWFGGVVGRSVASIVQSGGRIVQENVGTEVLDHRSLGELLDTSAVDSGTAVSRTP